MSDDPTRHARYLESLERLHRGWSHETRSHLGNISLQLDLMAEILARAGTGAEEVEPFRMPIDRARKGVARLERCLDRYLGAAIPLAAQAAPVDVGTALAGIGELLEPTARERRVSWSMAAPGAALAVQGDAQAIRERLAIAAIGLLFDAPEGSQIEVAAERSGTSVVVRFDGLASPFELVLPIAPETS
ncbi:MAG: hypothetical protein ABIS67_09995 [Candidatus Eisenbacteria bacterium]